jgi:tetratricopeptide (TPR) repeat protein
MATFNDIDQLQGKARYLLNLKNDRDKAAAVGREAVELLANAEVAGSRLGELHYNLASLFHDLGDLEHCEPLARRALELERGDKAEPHTLAHVLLLLARVLNERGQRAEAADLARESGEAFAHAFKPGDPELGFVRAEVARIVAGAK